MTEKKYTMDDYAMELRHSILITALALESLTSMYLAGLLGIKDYKNTKSFGNKNGNLSFNQKIELLTDLDALSKDDKKKFQTFMEVRNQFMHNIEIKSYTECFKMLDGKENYILKQFPQDKTIIKEVQLRIATESLGIQLMDIINNLANKIFFNDIHKIKSEMHILIQEKFSNSIQNMKNILEEKIKSKTAKKEGINNIDLEILQNEIENNFNGFWK